MERKYWDSFYATGGIVDIPSQFCVMVAQNIPANSNIIEFGCGSGRDTSYFSMLGHKVLGIDASVEAINRCNAKNVSNATFVNANVVDFQRVDLVKNFGFNPSVIYSRFFQHSLTKDEQDAMFVTLRNLSGLKKITCYFEFRNLNDAHNVHIYENHYRRYQSQEEFCNDLSKFGFQIEYQISGKGLAYFKGEDPEITRVIATSTL